jgi:hypothetical protein
MALPPATGQSTFGLHSLGATPMIARLWHCWTTPENADTYEALIKTEIFSGIVARKIAGFQKIELL